MLAAHELLKFYGEVSVSVFLAGKVQSLPQSLRGVFDLPGHESEQNLRDSEGQGSLACCSPWGRKDSDMTKRLNIFGWCLYLVK